MLRPITRFKLACRELYRDVLPFTATETVPSALFRRPALVQVVGTPAVTGPQEKKNVPLTIEPGTGFSSTSEKLSTPCDPDRKSTRLNSSHPSISYAVFCLKKKKKTK